jgi:hypothetical protein
VLKLVYWFSSHTNGQLDYVAEDNMKKAGKLLLGLATVWPIIYFFIFLILIFSTLLFGFEPGPDGRAPNMIAWILPLHLLTILVILGLTVFYIVDVFRNKRVEKDKKALWAIVIFLGNMIGMPIYWYLYIWKDPVVAAPSPAQLNSVDTSSWTSTAEAPHQEQPQYAPPTEPPNWR